MDYHLKYIKYKLKYLNLLNGGGGGEKRKATGGGGGADDKSDGGAEDTSDYGGGKVQKYDVVNVARKIEGGTVYICINTDPGADIDDELAIYHIIQQLQNVHCTYNIQVDIYIQAGHIDNINKVIGNELSPLYNSLGETLILGSTNVLIAKKVSVRVYQFDKSKPLAPPADLESRGPIKYNCILSIAKFFDRLGGFIDPSNLLSIVHQGVLSGVNSAFNDMGSTELWNYHDHKDKLFKIITPLESMKYLAGSEKTIARFPFTAQHADFSKEGSFAFLCARAAPWTPPVALSVIVNTINPKVAKEIQKPATYYEILMSIPLPKKPVSIPKGTEALILSCVKKYAVLANLALTKIDNKAYPGLKVFNDESCDFLYQMTLQLVKLGLPWWEYDHSVVGGDPLVYNTASHDRIENPIPNLETIILHQTTDPIRLLYNNNLMQGTVKVATKFPDQFELFKRIGLGTPVYDLLAADELLAQLHIMKIITPK